MTGRVRAVICGMFAMLLAGALLSKDAGVDRSRTFVTQVSPDLAIITELSVTEPYLGEQFSVVYRLRTKRALAAVDIDPQQYPGFWMESVPIDSQAVAEARASKDQSEIEYLLRQVILFPLMEGRQKVPPLSVKIRRARNTPASADDWDIVGSSAAVGLDVMPVPLPPGEGAKLPLVGNVAGTLLSAQENWNVVALDIEGNANLGMFQPLDWMHPSSGVSFQARLASTNRVTQTIEREGKRQVALLVRQHWLISVYGATRDRRIDGFTLSVFDPHDGVWRKVSISGCDLPMTHDAGQGEQQGKVTDSRGNDTRSRKFWDLLAGRAGMLAGTAIVVAFAWWLTAKRLHALKKPDDNSGERV